MHDVPEILITAERIRHRIAELAQQIDADYRGHAITFIGVLTGSLMFVADLVRATHLNTRIAFIQASSYRGETTRPGSLVIEASALLDVSNRDVVLVDDILDTGQTLARIRDLIADLGPRSLKIAVLLRKEGRQTIPVEPDYVGFAIPDAFVVGYGLDYNDEYRQLPYVAILHGK